METTTNEIAYTFKNDLFIFERNEFLKYQKLMERAENMENNKEISSEDMRKYQYTEMDFIFDVFPIFCISIAGETKTKDELKDYIRKVSMDEFEKIATTLWERIEKLANQKKKTN